MRYWRALRLRGVLYEFREEEERYVAIALVWTINDDDLCMPLLA